MGFLSGFVTGAATSIDNQLKKDMERTQDRMDGMEQYRVTRRRAKLEEQESEAKELRDVLKNLSAFTDGDEGKAIQLFKRAGQTVSGGNKLYEELLTNQQANKDISAALTFVPDDAEGQNFVDYISRNITPVTPLPVADDEMRASGLFRLFKPKLGSQLQKRVDDAAPLDKYTPTGVASTAMATVDRSGFIASEEAEEAAKQRERAEGTYKMSVTSFKTAQQQANQSMTLADKAAARLEKLDEQNASQQEIENARADLAAAREKQRLDLSIAAAERDATAFVTSQELQGVTLEQRQLELKKAKEAPQYSTYEAMLVSADQRVATLESIPLAQRTPTQQRDLADATAIRNKALSGIKSVADAESTKTYTPTFSKQSVDSIINSEIKRQLEPVGLVKDIEGEITYKIEGNEVQYFDRMSRALENVELRVGSLDDEQMNKTLEAQRNSISADTATYINKKLSTEGFIPSQAANQEDLLDKIEAGEYRAGDIIQYTDENNVLQSVLWTGNRLL